MFTTYFIADTVMDNSVNIMSSYQAMQNIIILNVHTTSQQMTRHPSSGALKVYGFHTIMIPYYLISQFTHWATKEVKQILMLALYPFLPWLRVFIHWIIVSITVTSLVTP